MGGTAYRDHRKAAGRAADARRPPHSPIPFVYTRMWGEGVNLFRTTNKLAPRERATVGVNEERAYVLDDH